MNVFLSNKYTLLYNRLIEQALTRDTPAQYVEKHHIIPKALGGTDVKSNIVELTAREHFICHVLLIKMTQGDDKRRMAFAMSMMCRSTAKHHRYLPRSSRWFAAIREYSISLRKGLKHKSHSKGWKHSDVAKKKISAAHLGKIMPQHTRSLLSKSHTGKKLSAEHKAAIRQTLHTTSYSHPQELVDRIAIANTGKKRSDETRAKIKQKRDAQVMPLKEWHLLKPDGTLIKTFRLKEFCQANKLGLSKLKETMVTKRPVDVGYSAGWMIVGFEKLTNVLTNR